MSVEIRPFEKSDVPLKVEWINNPKNNKYLHYHLPLIESKTYEWFEMLAERKDRMDLTIIYDGFPVGLIGLLNMKNGTAEYYICLGETAYKGRGIASIATKLLLEKSYLEYGLKNIYLFTEVENIPAQKAFEKIGFSKKQQVDDKLFYNEMFIKRFCYTLNLKSYFLEGDD